MRIEKLKGSFNLIKTEKDITMKINTETAVKKLILKTLDRFID
jgi:hypothetical protein